MSLVFSRIAIDRPVCYGGENQLEVTMNKSLRVFLELNGVLELYINNSSYLSDYPRFILLNNLCSDFYINSIATAFTWANTPEGNDFWYDLNELYREMSNSGVLGDN